MIALSSSFVFFFILALVSLFICLVRHFLKFLSSSKLKEEEEEEEKNNIRCWIDFLIKIQKIEKKNKMKLISFCRSRPLPPTPAHSRSPPPRSSLQLPRNCSEMTSGNYAVLPHRSVYLQFMSISLYDYYYYCHYYFLRKCFLTFLLSLFFLSRLFSYKYLPRHLSWFLSISFFSRSSVSVSPPFVTQ